nr:CHAT domain-containing protein [Oscillochloris sp. ZM17-4]
MAHAPQRPQLAILAACAGAGRDDGAEPLAALGPRLVAAGVPAVVAMQGNVSIASVGTLLPTLLAALRRDDCIDQAMAAARLAAEREHADWWRPTLTMRVRDGRLWDYPAPAHPLLPQIVPAFYQRDEAGQRIAPAAQGKLDEIATVLHRLLGIADDAGRALETGNPALAERGLERCLTNLRSLQGQMPGLGLRTEQTERWKPTFAQWEVTLQQAIECQRTLSQGELLNPFQTGNPLRPERKDLFKGRCQPYLLQLIGGQTRGPRR